MRAGARQLIRLESFLLLLASASHFLVGLDLDILRQNLTQHQHSTRQNTLNRIPTLGNN